MFRRVPGASFGKYHGGSSLCAAQPGGSVLEVRLASFNFGIDENMLELQKGQGKWSIRAKRVLNQLIRAEDRATPVDLLFGFEGGGRKQGLRTERLQDAIPEDMFIRGTMHQNYLTLTATRCAEAGCAHEITLSNRSLSPQLTVTGIRLAKGGRVAYLLVGNLHLRAPSGKKAPTVETKQCLVTEALQCLETEAEVLTSPAALVLLQCSGPKFHFVSV